MFEEDTHGVIPVQIMLAGLLRDAWINHLTTNSGAHALNGNGTYPQMRFKGGIVTGKQIGRAHV